MAGCASCGLPRGACGCSAGFAVNVAGSQINYPPPRPVLPNPLCNTLAHQLIRSADVIRNLYTTYGLRPYNVSLIHTRWSGGKRNIGVEEVVDVTNIVPTPLLSDLSQVAQVNSPIGLDEIGDILVSEVSGAYTENQLTGYTPGMLLAKDENFYWEIEFPPPCEGQPGERRRFTVNAAPMYYADKFQWQIRLTRQRVDRTRSGVPGGP